MSDSQYKVSELQREIAELKHDIERCLANRILDLAEHERVRALLRELSDAVKEHCRWLDGIDFINCSLSDRYNQVVKKMKQIATLDSLTYKADRT